MNEINKKIDLAYYFCSVVSMIGLSLKKLSFVH